MTNKINPHILIVDDDKRILSLLEKFLKKHNYYTSVSSSAKQALEIIKNFQVDLIILDVMMPEMSGIEFAQKLKKTKAAMPIIMLTALSEPEDRIKGLEAGARDYVAKPFEPRELLLRIENLLKAQNFKKELDQLRRFGAINYNLLTKELLNNGTPILLSSSEEKLLEYLIKIKGTIISREDLAKYMNGINLRSIDVQIVRLRHKIEADPKNPRYLKTIRHQGYALYC